MRALLAMHIAAGSVAIIAGYIALFAAKGAHLHRRSGMYFVIAMLVMGLSGAVIAAFRGISTSVTGGVTAAYFVVTALTAVRKTSTWSRTADVGLLAVALALSSIDFAWGVRAIAHPERGVPTFMFFVLASVLLLAAVGDVRALLARELPRTTRLARHLWRMCFALWMAAGSFFLGQAKVIPKPIRIFPLLAIPPLFVLVAMLHWLWRVRATNHKPEHTEPLTAAEANS